MSTETITIKLNLAQARALGTLWTGERLPLPSGGEVVRQGLYLSFPATKTEATWREISDRSKHIPCLRPDGKAIRSVLDKVLANNMAAEKSKRERIDNV